MKKESTYTSFVNIPQTMRDEEIETLAKDLTKDRFGDYIL